MSDLWKPLGQPVGYLRQGLLNARPSQVFDFALDRPGNTARIPASAGPGITRMQIGQRASDVFETLYTAGHTLLHRNPFNAFHDQSVVLLKPGKRAGQTRRRAALAEAGSPQTDHVFE
jgi:hypothetical protein